MKIDQRSSKRGLIINLLALAVALGLLAVLPVAMVSEAFEAGLTEGTPILVRQANLVSPSGSVNPHGFADYNLYADGNREIEVEVQDVNMADGTVLDVFVDGNQIGQASLLGQTMNLTLRTEDGQDVPVTEDGSAVEVKLGTTVVVSGVLGGGGPNPSPSSSPTSSPTESPTASPTESPTASPTASPTESPSSGDNEIYAGLSGPTIDGVLPKGYAEYEVQSDGTEFDVCVRQINLPAGTQLAVKVDGVDVGTMALGDNGEARLELDSSGGQIVPVVNSGSTIEIFQDATIILSGTFSGSTSPAPSPSPGEPSQGRHFEASLTGSGFNPPVSTSGIGEVEIYLNDTETEATITAEFDNLSSPQTGAKIEADLGTIVLIQDLGVLGGTEGHFAPVTIPVTGAEVEQLRAGVWFATISSENNPAGELRGQIIQDSDGADFDGDGSSDFAVFRPSTTTWYSMNSQGFSASQFGAVSDTPVSADYDGDGKTDKAVFRDVNGSGVWIINRSSDGGETVVQFGYGNDIPVRGDFDGDNISDIAVFRPSTGVWYVKKSNNSGYIIVQFGLKGDRPVAGDFDGDGKADISVFRPTDGNWYKLSSIDGSFSVVHWGIAEDIPVRGDFDGDGRDDAAVFRPSTGVWYIYRSSDSGITTVKFGISEDKPVPGRFDADNKTDIAVFRPSTGTWYVLNSSDGSFVARQFGSIGDIPATR